MNPCYIQESLQMFNIKNEIDLFASRLNEKFTNYSSYRLDPEAAQVDAFSIPWNNLKFYCFSPFSCVLQTIQKIIQEQATGIIVNPNLATQP